MSIPINSALTPGGLMMASVIFLFILFLVVLFLYLHIRRRRGPPNYSLASSPILSSSSNSSTAAPLDPGVLKSLPSTAFRSAVDRNGGCGPECAVCLSELADGELSRFLPCCRHVFHLQCIDTWFLSNSTCPICRSSVEPPAAAPESSLLAEEEIKAPALTIFSSEGLATEESSSNHLEIRQHVAAARDVCERG